MDITEEQAAEALRAAAAVLLTAGARTATEAAPAPDQPWQLPGGTAWVYYGEGHQGLVRPVLLADGFNTGRSDLDLSWETSTAADTRSWTNSAAGAGMSSSSAATSAAPPSWTTPGSPRPPSSGPWPNASATNGSSSAGSAWAAW
ncbi:hypothetical protein O1M07_25380 [Streptomyces albulus]|nr:hypothetical protein [Streptomyces noursei]MCZ1017448.1 hypothetical protein [Streptomyces noursei]GGX19276.1 hypothetical protein GCM10010341_45800 [Streptomyces noursei]